MQVGDLMAFINMSQIMFSLMMMSMLFVMIPGPGFAGRINAVLETTSRLKDGERLTVVMKKPLRHLQLPPSSRMLTETLTA